MTGDTESVRNKIYALQSALEERVPNIKTYLADIHKTLAEDPEVVTALSEEEISTVVKGLMQYANLEIPVSKTARKNKKTPVTAADL